MDLESVLIKLLDSSQDELETEEIDPSRISNIKLNDEPVNGKEDLKEQFRFLIDVINSIIKYIDTVEIDNLDIAEYCIEIMNLQIDLQNIEVMLEEEQKVIIDPQE